MTILFEFCIEYLMLTSSTVWWKTIGWWWRRPCHFKAKKKMEPSCWVKLFSTFSKTIQHRLTCGRLIALVLFLDRLWVVVCGALVQSQRGDLFVALPTVAALVRFTRCVNHLMLVQTWVLGEALLTARNGANIRPFTWGWKEEITF